LKIIYLFVNIYINYETSDRKDNLDKLISRSRLMIISVILLYIPYSIKILLRNIIYVSDYNLTNVSRLVLILNISSESDRFHYTELIKSMNWEIRNFSLGINRLIAYCKLFYWFTRLSFCIQQYW